ncbi:MAG: hypothetical protein ACYSTG_09375 [Planctomycetota bacterium]|jgi:membrane-bound metal-dependent hydrolase YbcI (DUF457 family)
MPFTPFHFGPSGCIALALRKYIDIPVFVLVNVVIDLEPGIVLAFDLDYRAHGYCHTLLFGTVIGLAWALVAYLARNPLKRLMGLFGLQHETSLSKVILSALLGIWFHVVIDSFCWRDIRPFWPSDVNPLYALTTRKTIRLLCAVTFVPAIALYINAVIAQRRERDNATS